MTRTQGEGAADPAHAAAFADIDARGVAVFRGVVDRARCASVRDRIWSTLEAASAARVRAGEGPACPALRRDDPLTWDDPILSKPGFVEIFTHPAMWEIRQDPAIYAIFAALYGQEALWVSIDRVGWKRPAFYAGEGGAPVRRAAWNRDIHVHTDLNYWHPPPRRMFQGILALDDTDADQGGFACIPGFHLEYRAWRDAHPAWAAPRGKAFVTFPDKERIARDLAQVPARAGDLIVFDSLLPHTTTPNRSGRWRYCQYVTFFPAEFQNLDRQQIAREAWETGRRPEILPGGQRVYAEGSLDSPADAKPPLTPLGRRLAGLDPWTDRPA